MAHADVMADHVSHGSGHQMGFVRIDVDAETDGFGGADRVRYGHTRSCSGKRFPAEQLGRVLVHFVQFARNVIVEIEQGPVDVLRPIHQSLVLAGPRFDVNHRHASVQRLEVLQFCSNSISLVLTSYFV